MFPGWMCGDMDASDFPSVSNINSRGPLLWAQKLHCHEAEGEKEASQAEDIARGPFCVSPRVPGFYLLLLLLCLVSAQVLVAKGLQWRTDHVSWRPRQPCWQRPVGVRRLVVPSVCDPGQQPRASPSPGGKAFSIQAALLGLGIHTSSPVSMWSSANFGAPSSHLFSAMPLNPGVNLDFFWTD